MRRANGSTKEFFGLETEATSEFQVSPTQVNSYTTSFQYSLSVATDSSGNFVVVWSSIGSAGSDSASYSVQGQNFAGPVPVELLKFRVD